MSTTRRSASEESEGSSAPPPAPIEVLNRQRLRPVNRAGLARLARAVLDRIRQPQATATITFIRDREMRRLNRAYRGIDAPTDVLSFAYHETAGGPGAEGGHLGDVVIAVETAERDARARGLTFSGEISRLVIHGILHLAGYDHETDDGQMQRLERRLRRELLLSDRPSTVSRQLARNQGPVRPKLTARG
jgi:probable rRNA maturation factor